MTPRTAVTVDGERVVIGKRHKYNAQRTNGYDSAAEARFAETLEALKAAGRICLWDRAVAIDLVRDLHPGEGRHKKSCITYVPDFRAYTLDYGLSESGMMFLFDVKSPPTLIHPLFRLKRKLLHWQWPTLPLILVDGAGTVLRETRPQDAALWWRVVEGNE